MAEKGVTRGNAGKKCGNARERGENVGTRGAEVASIPMSMTVEVAMPASSSFLMSNSKMIKEYSSALASPGDVNI